MSETVEYETVTLKLPKHLLNYLRAQDNTGLTLEGYLEYSLVECVRADIEAGVFSEVYG
jgi:hypothetical protein